jgi:hypothetical protein
LGIRHESLGSDRAYTTYCTTSVSASNPKTPGWNGNFRLPHRLTDLFIRGIYQTTATNPDAAMLRSQVNNKIEQSENHLQSIGLSQKTCQNSGFFGIQQRYI